MIDKNINIPEDKLPKGNTPEDKIPNKDKGTYPEKKLPNPSIR